MVWFSWQRANCTGYARLSPDDGIVFILLLFPVVISLMGIDTKKKEKILIQTFVLWFSMHQKI